MSHSKKNNLVVKDNALIDASYNLDIVEQRLILLAIIEARETGKGVTKDNFLRKKGQGLLKRQLKKK